MERAEYLTRLAAIGKTQTDMATACKVQLASAYCWGHGERHPFPGYVAAVLEGWEREAALVELGPVLRKAVEEQAATAEANGKLLVMLGERDAEIARLRAALKAAAQPLARQQVQPFFRKGAA